MTSQRPSLMRDRGGPQRVTNVELFFDLVFVFAVTQLSRYLLTRQASGGGARSALFAVRAITDPALHRNFQRILAWCVLSGSLALAGGIVTGLPRVLLWAAAVAVDFAGGLAGFYTPAYHLIHPIMVAGIIVAAAADWALADLAVRPGPDEAAPTWAAWMIPARAGRGARRGRCGGGRGGRRHRPDPASAGRAGSQR